jgi:hypothetical protein
LRYRFGDMELKVKGMLVLGGGGLSFLGASMPGFCIFVTFGFWVIFGSERYNFGSGSVYWTTEQYYAYNLLVWSCNDGKLEL